MNRFNTIIIGAGLAGLWAARQLERLGRGDCLVLEAREEAGGRLRAARLSGPAGGGADFDLGATWFWPDMQPGLAAAVRELGLKTFPQHEDGAMLVERAGNAQPQRYAGYPGSPASVRVAGGMRALVAAVASQLESTTVRYGHRVSRVAVDDAGIIVCSQDAHGALHRLHVDQILLALPPRLAAQTIEFTPALPEPLSRAWRATPTWMAPHAKYVAAYARPFWRDAGLSGQARSERGPLVEIHDASTQDGAAALFGFVGVPAAMRQRMSTIDLQGLCRMQLARLFGPEATTPMAEWLCDWSTEPFTATAADGSDTGHHAEAPPPKAEQGPWRHRLVGIASEWSAQFPGYVAGAIDAADAGASALCSADALPRSRS